MLKSKKEVAEIMGITTRELSVYISRRKIICDGERIDIESEHNLSFIKKKLTGKGRADKKEAPAQAAPAKAVKIKAVAAEEDEDLDGIPAFTKSERLLKHLDTMKRQQEVAMMKLKEEKIRGEMLPSKLIMPVFLQHNQSFITSFKNGSEEIIRLFSKKKGLSGAEVAELRGQFIEIINDALKKTTAATVKAVKHIITEHSESRGVGERV